MMQTLTRTCSSVPYSLLLIRSMATQKPNQSSTKTVASKKEVPSVKLLTRVEQLRLLMKAEKAGLLSAAEEAGLSLSTIERLGLSLKLKNLVFFQQQQIQEPHQQSST